MTGLLRNFAVVLTVVAPIAHAANTPIAIVNVNVIPMDRERS
jgi:hypothetical protein